MLTKQRRNRRESFHVGQKLPGGPGGGSVKYRVFKRFFDVALALLLLPLAILICGIFGSLFLVSQRLRPIYRQERTGLGNRKFLVWKLRTMTEERDAKGVLLPDEKRLSRLGKFMRATSIDELPQFINICLLYTSDAADE